MQGETRFRFTDEKLRHLKAPDQGELNLHDSQTPGLGVRLRPNGAGQFVVRYRLPGVASPRRMTLGVVGQLKLAEARQMALAAIASAKSGTDPSRLRAERAADENGVTLGDIINSYEREQTTAKIRHAIADAATLRREFRKLITKPVKLLSRKDFSAILKQVRDGAAGVKGRPAVAQKARTLLHGALELALADGVIPSNVLAGMREKRGSRKQKNIELATKAARALPLDDLAALWRACDDKRVPPSFGRAVQFLIVTGCRRNEAALARRDWLRRAKGDEPAFVTLPGAITKNGIQHEVFLPEFAMAPIAAYLSTHNEELLFPGRRSRKTGAVPPISGWSKSWPALLTIAKEYGLDKSVTPHDLRRSVRTGYEAMGISARIAEEQLNHRNRDRLDAIYNEHDYRVERIKAAAQWVSALQAAVDSAKAQHKTAA